MAEAAWEISGWRMYYQIGIKESWFNGTHKTPFESVFYSDFAQFVELMALKNSVL